jgi:spermidine synthase
MPSGCADAVVVDAFAGASVPAELATRMFFADAVRVLRDGVLVMNVTDSAPFDWSKRCIAGIVASAAEVAVVAEVPILKGRRFGNLIIVAGAALPLAALADRLRQAAFPHRLLAGHTLRDWLGGAQPFEEADARPSPEPNWSRTWFSSPQRHR